MNDENDWHGSTTFRRAYTMLADVMGLGDSIFDPRDENACGSLLSARNVVFHTLSREQSDAFVEISVHLAACSLGSVVRPPEAELPDCIADAIEAFSSIEVNPMHNWAVMEILIVALKRAEKSGMILPDAVRRLAEVSRGRAVPCDWSFFLRALLELAESAGVQIEDRYHLVRTA